MSIKSTHTNQPPLRSWLNSRSDLALARAPLLSALNVMLAASLDPKLEATHQMQWRDTWFPIRHLLPRAIRNANAELIAPKAALQAFEKLLPSICANVLIAHGTKASARVVSKMSNMSNTNHEKPLNG